MVVVGVALGVAAFAAAAVMPTPLRIPALVVGMACLLLAATALSRAGQLASRLGRFCNRPVRILVWGAPVPAAGEPPMTIEWIRAVGAGLLISLRQEPSGKKYLLKVAQPGPGRVEEDRFEIEAARYVSWKGVKLAQAAGHPALEVHAS